MSDWYEQLELGSDLVRISEPLVSPLLSAKLWWLRGTDRDLVVDAGLGVVALRGEIPRMFERDPLVVLTHAHLDHVGGAHEFRERAAHPADAAILAAGVPASLYGAELYEKLGINAEGEPVPDLLIKDLPYPEYDPRTYRVEAVTLSRQLDDGDQIDLGDRTLTVLHLPGHSPGSIALLEERTGVLFSGDVVYDGYLIDDLPDSDVPAYRRSMESLAQLDVSVVHPGHGRSFDQTRLRELAHAYLHKAGAEQAGGACG
ncbi:MBL fold metallo-hydrolase [Kitasatospora sp. NPDC050543]|uniref:MBL fold metallo-hydrolase n=1 Tax=Kitasatospora sp. NPDC050543 TaxID=3364054 RepID=UPI00378E581B